MLNFFKDFYSPSYRFSFIVQLLSGDFHFFSSFFSAILASLLVSHNISYIPKVSGSS